MSIQPPKSRGVEELPPQLDLVDRELIDGVVNDPYFNPLFIQDGYAILLQGRFVCVPEEDAQFEFGIEYIETEATLAEQGLECANGYTCRSGDSFHYPTNEGLCIEAFTVDGPFRSSPFHPEARHRLLRDLSDLIGRIQQQLEEASTSWDPKEVQECSGNLPSAETLLDDLCKECERRRGDPYFARFLEMPSPPAIAQSCTES
jgi:hypothetical protein